MNKFIDLTGNIYTKLTVLARVDNNKHGQSMWLCRCECGNTKIVRQSHILSGNTKSCGCFYKERIHEIHLKHGHNKKKHTSSTYKSWSELIQRCTNPNNKRYERYMGRGITVCTRWLNSFENFLEDMGERPSKDHSIDRIDNDGNYEPSNCRWTTYKEQNSNQRSNVWMTFNGETKLQTCWADE